MRCDSMSVRQRRRQRQRQRQRQHDNDKTTTTSGNNGARQLHKSTTFSVLKRLAIHSWLWPLLPSPSPSTIRVLRLSFGSRILELPSSLNPLSYRVCEPCKWANACRRFDIEKRTAVQFRIIRVLGGTSKSRANRGSVDAMWSVSSPQMPHELELSSLSA